MLKTDRDMPAEELWRLYMTLLEAESGFRMLKRSLGLRPNFHQKDDRGDGHVFISVPAYHLLCRVRRRLEEKGGRGGEWKTIRRLLRTHALVSTRLPLADGRIIVRKPSVPDAEQARIFSLLGVDGKALRTARSGRAALRAVLARSSIRFLKRVIRRGGGTSAERRLF